MRYEEYENTVWLLCLIVFLGLLFVPMTRLEWGASLWALGVWFGWFRRGGFDRKRSRVVDDSPVTR